ncbi:VQ motif-containing protein motif-containing protein 1-like [Forsythia ovata]|uniref:VQ motif-containing protein motif-containing protein 1-like n=1 Tax=Forsythia ovata TaxID=205694 RepID=A0ABD1QCG0_9LAMI
MGGGNREAVKVVIINTQYVETDAMSFKSVVQRLTGKDSTQSSFAHNSKQQPMFNGTTSPLSFGDFDRMLRGFLPLEELAPSSHLRLKKMNKKMNYLMRDDSG